MDGYFHVILGCTQYLCKPTATVMSPDLASCMVTFLRYVQRIAGEFLKPELR
jgi:hypothetical protein